MRQISLKSGFSFQSCWSFQDGTYVKSQNSKLNYGAMVFVRVVIVYDMVNYLSRAVTIATRYSAVRRQSQLRPG